MAQSALAQTVVYQDDFEGAVSGWSSNTTENAPIIGTNFLGRFGGPNAETSRTFTVPAGATALDIEFDLLRFDSWDFFNAANQDGFTVLIDGNPLFSTTAGFGTVPRLPFPVGQGPRSGTTGNVDWAHVRLNPTDAQVNAGNAQQELGFTTGQFWFDQIHRFTINVNNPGATVDLTLRFDTDQTIGDESAGFDNFLVTAIAPAPVIGAVNDDYTGTALFGGDATPSVFTNDDINGTTPNATNVDVSLTNLDGLTGASINPDGTIEIPAGAAAGNYTLTYEICQAGDATNCTTADVDILIEDIVIPTILCDGFNVAPLSFSGATLSSGTNLRLGSVYNFTNVAPGVDGQVEVLGTFNGASLSAIDNDAGLTSNFQPELVPNPAGGGYVAFRVSFFDAASGQPQPLDFSATQIDIDGDSQTLREFVEFDTSFSQFTVDTTTELLINASGPTNQNFSRFESTTSTTAPGIDPTAQANVVRAVYTNATSYDFVYGTLGAGATTRLASVGFDCPSIPNPVNAIPDMTADLVTVKSLAASASATPAVGDIVTYEITVTNNGPDVATNVNLTDGLPAGLTATSNNGTVSDGSYIGNDWSIPALQSGDTATLTLEGTVDTDQGGNTITNTLAGPATSDVDDPSTAGDDLTETVTVETIIEAADNDFSATPIAPGAASVTTSIFDNDMLNGIPFTPADVTASIVDDGSVFGATINADGTLNIPAGIAPGIYQLVYEICDVNDATNCDTAIVTIAIQASTPDAGVTPSVCGDFLSQGWVTHGKLNLNDAFVDFGSGDFATDPYLYLPMERDADGRIRTYFGAVSGTDSGTLSTPALAELVTSQRSDADHESEVHVIAYRLEGVPGSTVTADLDTRSGQEHTAYWVEDTAGNVIDTSDFQFTSGVTSIGGVGEVLPVSFTAPADGIVYLKAVIMDPSAFFGKPIISNYQCPAPSLSMTKVADSEGLYTAGEVVTYTYTVVNDGDTTIRGVAITDTHNGSDLAPVPGNETLLTDAAPTGDSTDASVDGYWDVLAPGDTLTFTGTYTITQIDAENL